jgi:hypothetical protein
VTEDATADASPFETSGTPENALARLGLVVATAVTALAVLGLAWTVAPQSGAASALAAGAVAVIALLGLGVTAELRTLHETVDAQAEALDVVREAHEQAVAAPAEADGELAERVAALESRLDEVQQRQTEQLADWIQATEPPEAAVVEGAGAGPATGETATPEAEAAGAREASS